jgi:hypothetical protein
MMRGACPLALPEAARGRRQLQPEDLAAMMRTLPAARSRCADLATRVLLFAVITITSNCARPKAAIPAPPASHASSEWIDLQPGWRVRVITPVVPGGGYVVKTTPVEDQTSDAKASERRSPSATNAIVISATSNLIGYEVSFYDVKPRRGGGVHVVFDSAEVHKKDQWSRSRQPIDPLFHFVSDARYVRILHLSRGTHDHDAAILAASRHEALETLTRRVESDPAGCQSSRDALCSWIPSGIAAIPESWRSAGGQGQWQPAF